MASNTNPGDDHELGGNATDVAPVINNTTTAGVLEASSKISLAVFGKGDSKTIRLVNHASDNQTDFTGDLGNGMYGMATSNPLHIRAMQHELAYNMRNGGVWGFGRQQVTVPDLSMEAPSRLLLGYRPPRQIEAAPSADGGQGKSKARTHSERSEETDQGDGQQQPKRKRNRGKAASNVELIKSQVKEAMEEFLPQYDNYRGNNNRGNNYRGNNNRGNKYRGNNNHWRGGGGRGNKGRGRGGRGRGGGNNWQGDYAGNNNNNWQAQGQTFAASQQQQQQMQFGPPAQAFAAPQQLQQQMLFGPQGHAFAAPQQQFQPQLQQQIWQMPFGPQGQAPAAPQQHQLQPQQAHPQQQQPAQQQQPGQQSRGIENSIPAARQPLEMNADIPVMGPSKVSMMVIYDFFEPATSKDTFVDDVLKSL
jgi:hypothetical protein